MTRTLNVKVLLKFVNSFVMLITVVYLYSDNNNIKTHIMTTEFKIIGFTDKVNECDCCGRTELKGTYCISIDGSEFYYGTSCATKKGADKVSLKKELAIYESTVKFVNSFIFKKGLELNKTNEILTWSLNNKGKSLNIFL